MDIRITYGSGRRMAWTDKRNGYMEWGSDTNDGYYRGAARLLTGFCAAGRPLKEADEICVRPEGFTAHFADCTLTVSLLLDEQAFYLSSEKDAGIAGIPTEERHNEPKTPADSADTAAPIPEPADADTAQAAATADKPIIWKKTVIDGCTVVSSSKGFAAAAEFDFHYTLDADGITFHRTQKAAAQAAFETAGWYAVFEEDADAAETKAVRLAKTRAIRQHCATIREFLEKCRIESGNKTFDEAFAWARMSGWMLSTKDHESDYRGIWAGLPWFRDNWGRDTFIALTGILLASGRMAEAKDVLLGFADFQDLNPESPSYGRIPNRYRNENDVIYNTADGTLWFIRALWEYVQYSGDATILQRLQKTLTTALDAGIRRTDAHGFLLHGDADTWMDARIAGREPWSPRGDRAIDVQALWFTALRIGALSAQAVGDSKKAETYAELARKVKDSFCALFWNPAFDAFADFLPPGAYGEWTKDMKVRPNQLFAITAPLVLPESEENRLLDERLTQKILENVQRELVSPFGLFSLSPEDPLFHPEHENPAWHHKDAAYHNGTIWEWNSGAYVSAACAAEPFLCADAAAIIQNEAKMIMDWGAAGSLSENIHARPDSDGNPVLSGTFSQAWSLAEYVRVLCQDVAGFVPRLAEGALELHPHLPENQRTFAAVLPFGQHSSLAVDIERIDGAYRCRATWRSDAEDPAALLLNGQRITAGETRTLIVQDKTPARRQKTGKSAGALRCPKTWLTEDAPPHDLAPFWCGALHQKDYLENLILSGRMQSKTAGGTDTAALEWLFDSKAFEEKYATSETLGAVYGADATLFRLWAPTARQVALVLYADGSDTPEKERIPMRRKANGVWETSVRGDLHGVYYRFCVRVHGTERLSADPYAHAAGVNGVRSMVVDMRRTDPDGWERVNPPITERPSDAVVYEAHVADITSSPHWHGAASLRRTFSGAAAQGIRFDGEPAGFDHIKSLGVTHVQFLPLFDFRSVDETKIRDRAYASRPTAGLFNWGYDPENYGVPEGSYSSDPFDGSVRIRELKSMIRTFAENGIGIVMDVVFNHVNDGAHHPFNLCVPGYYYRVEGYSGAGEDTASEHAMMRRYMIDMLSFWLSEYKLCGFRFDLMGLHDAQTMNAVRDALRKIKKDVLLYGEGWCMYAAKKMIPADMRHAAQMPEIGFFNDALRCAVKGPVFADREPGFIHDGRRREALKFGIVGATAHPQIDASLIEGTANPEPWGTHTWRSVNYTEIHDNMTLFDKLMLTEPGKPLDYYVQMQKFALSLVILAEGMPVLHAGMEFMRTKEVPKSLLDADVPFADSAKIDINGEPHVFLRNTYNVTDAINALDWRRAAQNRGVVDYTRKLIALRKAHAAFRIADAAELAAALTFLDADALGLPEAALAWQLDGKTYGDKWQTILLVANPLETPVPFTLPAGIAWQLVTDGARFTPQGAEARTDNAPVTLLAKSLAVYAARV